VSDAFNEHDYSAVLLYALDSMCEVEPSYANKAFHIGKRIQEKLSKELKNRKYNVDFRYQGPIQTETHIVLYGDIELMVIAESVYSEPWKVVKNITMEMMDILTQGSVYQRVDNSDKLKIRVQTLKPSCEINILPAVWLENKEYKETKREIDRGVTEFNMLRKTRRRYLPFKHIARINGKDAKTNGGLKRVIRLLRTLVQDTETTIDLTPQEIESIMYAIPEKQLIYEAKKPLALLNIAFAQLSRLSQDLTYLQKLVSPSERELVFGRKAYKQAEINRLKDNLNELISALSKELKEDDKNLYSEIRY
jgi:hypothetical protein